MGAMDSSAELLFRISADSSDAEGNVKRFRTLMSKDLSDLKSEFSDWATKVFGDLSTVQGQFTAMAAAGMAAGVGIAGALVAAAEKAADYALEIGRGSLRTGIAAEDMSRLRYAADITRTSYDSLVTGLTRFASTIDKARDPTSQQAQAFHRMGIGQAEIESGSKNMLPLLYRVSDAFYGQMTATERTAMSRELFSRGGAEMIAMLSKGSVVLKGFGKEAEGLGLIMSTKDVQAAKEYKAETSYLKAEIEGLALSIGKHVVPALQDYFIGAVAIAGGIKGIFTGNNNFFNIAQNFADGFVKTGLAAVQRVKDAARGALMDVPGLGAPGGDKDTKTKEATQDYWGLSSILETVKQRLASATSEEEKIASETAHMTFETQKAQKELAKLREEGKITPESLARETAVLGALPGSIAQMSAQMTQKLTEKRNAAILAASDDLQQRIQSQQEQTYANQVALWNDEINKLQDRLAKEKLLTTENQAALTALRQAGIDRLDRAQSQAFVGELEKLQQELAAVVTARFTAQERIEWQYEQDQVRYSAVEEAKTLATAKDEAQRDAIRQQYALNRQAADKRYQQDLQTLRNSQGWQGVFGSTFAQAIRGNEQLLREWASSAHQSLLMGQVAVEALGESSQRAFGSFSQAMGQNIAQAIVYKKSIGEAIQSAVASTLEGLAAESIMWAVYSTGLGFVRLAQYDYTGAAEAFKAAAVFGTVGVTAAVAGRMIAPSDSSSSSTSVDSSSASGSSSSSSSSSSTSGSGHGAVTVIVQGHIIGRSGIDELTEIINEAVKDRDVKLVATAVKQTTRVTQ
jgi:hypothetical protein